MNKKYIFVTSYPRSSATIFTSRLDRSPEILCWPFEFFYFDFFNENSNGQNKIIGSKLNNSLINVFKTQLFKKIVNHNNLIKKKLDKKFNFNYGDFNYDFFESSLQKRNHIFFDRFEYLNFIFECLKDSIKFYKKRKIDFYLLLTTARGFDFNLMNQNNYLFFLFNLNKLNSLNALKNKIIKRNSLEKFYSIKNKKNFFYWLFSYNLIEKELNKINKKKKLQLFYESANLDLKKIIKINDKNSKKIYQFLNLKSYPIMEPSLFGKKYAGNHQGKYAYPIFKIDKFFLDNLDIKNKNIKFPNIYDKIIYILEIFYHFYRVEGVNLASLIKSFRVLFNLIQILRYKSYKEILRQIIQNNKHLKLSLFFNRINTK